MKTRCGWRRGPRCSDFPQEPHYGDVWMEIPAQTIKHSFLIGLGTRVRVLDTVYVSAEYVPRVSGFANGDDDLSVACE